MWLMPSMLRLAQQSFVVDLDMCAFGALAPDSSATTPLFTKKATRLLTNFPQLKALRLRCPGNHQHQRLTGRFHDPASGKSRSRTTAAAAYPLGLVRAWSKCSRSALVPRRSFALTAWARLFLVMSGIEPHPGPARGARRRPLAGADLFTGDVAQITADRYADAVSRFETFLACRGFSSVADVVLADGVPRLIHLASSYLRSSYTSGELSASGAGNCISGLRRFLLLAANLGAAVGDPRAALQPLWRLHRTWLREVPGEFRKPIPLFVALAIATAAWSLDLRRLAVITLLQFHCLLRPAECRSVRWRDIVIFSERDRVRYPGVYGVVGIGNPKTRFMPQHAPEQHVLIVDLPLALFLQQVVALVPRDRLDESLWTRPAAEHLTLWRRVLLRLGLGSSGFTPAGLRGGGATEFHLCHQDVPRLRRRGRWTQLTTLDRYLQEGVYLLHRFDVSADARERLEELADLAVDLFAETHPDHPPRVHPYDA